MVSFCDSSLKCTNDVIYFTQHCFCVVLCSINMCSQTSHAELYCTLRHWLSARRNVSTHVNFRAFSVLCPRLWNSLLRLLHDTSHNTTSFGHSLKTFFSLRVLVHTAY